ncbi:hypothetical protein GJ744_012270 [Endocarpon pusillum]|uniref:DNA replication checkpoint mediator MRC1 domain-containing protein n=1 Tax=Endocarpon pusillum TaxID=364733 RepID=A0A8H7AET0_9EURO|nr:hypothetical protein GJ744_012270 [Endocarpon pusillum]
MLTPGRKVKALLAQFNDSDSDDNLSAKNVGTSMEHDKAIEPGQINVNHYIRTPQEIKAQDQASEDEVLSRRPRGHLAARMQATAINDNSTPSDEGSGTNAYARIKDSIAQISKPKNIPSETLEEGSSGDELRSAAPRRRLLQERDTAMEDHLSRQGTRSPSPLFFPSPSAAKLLGKAPSSNEHHDASDSDQLPEEPLKQSGSKFLALVEKHRKQRLAREAAEEAKRAERLAQLKKAGSKGSSNEGAVTLDVQSDESDDSDRSIGNRLTQQARPTRKASKRALEEMSRETQRMSRSMQLAHQARTKKKITKESLLARFNLITPGSGAVQRAETGHASATASSDPASDAEGVKKQQTPPTSPLPFEGDKQPPTDLQGSAKPAAAAMTMGGEEPPEMRNLLTSQPTTLQKGKAKVATIDDTTDAAEEPTATLGKPRVRPVRVRWSKQDAVIARGADSDSDLEIVTSKSKSKKFAVFERLPQTRSKETNSHLILRSLAHLQTGSADDKHASMNAAQMEAQLRRAARVQAQKERQEKLEELKSRGIFVQTAEERQKEQEDVEDLVERARMEGAEIQRREKEMAKKDGTFVKDELDDDESDDEDDTDFQDEHEGLEDPISGSEDELEEEDDIDQEDVEREDDLDAEPARAEMIEEEAGEAQSNGFESQHSEDEDIHASGKEKESPQLPARRRRILILSDDEDENEHDSQHHTSPQITKTPQSIIRSARKVIPGLQMSDDLPIGLTQAFAATMADSEVQDEAIATQEQDSLVLTRDLPSPNFKAVPSLRRLESLDVITDSQPATQTQPLDLDLSITQAQAVPQSPAGMSSTQFSFVPTQDVGYVMSPFRESRFDTPLAAPHSTIDTVILPPEEQSPILQRKGRLRRGRAAVGSDEEGMDNEDPPSGLGLDKSAFMVMQRAAKTNDQEDAFDRSKSYAKEIVDEAAEESEDEYAGLGGASDDEEGEEDEADRHIIDNDENLGQGDESKLAGFYADKERKQDEAAVSKLLKDITTGGLRRKRGAADDLDVSDEEDAIARRREVKRREFARMRRELLKDEAVGKIAEDKKKQAFLKSIEDRDAAEDEDIAVGEVEQTAEDTQWQTRSAEESSSQTDISMIDDQSQRKRPLEPSTADVINRQAPSHRRTSNQIGIVQRKPSTLAEIREQVSILMDEPNSQSGTRDPDSSEDDAQEPEAYVNLNRHLHPADEENEDPDEGLADFIVDDERLIFKKPQLPTARAPATERRTKPNVVDRLSLLRQSSSASSSSSSSTSTSSHSHSGSKLAFFTSKSSADNPSSLFKVPALLRGRATTNSSFNSDTGSNISATGVTERGAVENEKEMIRKAQGGRRSAINYYAKGRVEEREKVREGRVAKSIKVKHLKSVGKGKGKAGFLGGLFGESLWE